jgi:hypothetical protein
LNASFVQSHAFYTVGFFESSVDFNPASGTANFTSIDGRDAFIQRFSRTCSPDSTIDSVVACDQYTWVNGVTYTSNDSGEVFQSANGVGCDSVSILDLTIHESAYINDIFNRCNDYTWFVNGQTYDSSGTYTVTFTSQEGCDSIHALQLTIDTLDTAVTVSGTQLTASNVATKYQWLDCNNSYQPISSETNQVFNPTVNGAYAVAIENGACKDTSGCHNINSIPTGVENNGESNDIQLYPNPATNEINISGLKSNGEYQIQISNISGQELLMKRIEHHKNKTVIRLSLSPGFYILHIIDDAGITKTSDFIVE